MNIPQTEAGPSRSGSQHSSSSTLMAPPPPVKEERSRAPLGPDHTEPQVASDAVLVTPAELDALDEPQRVTSAASGLAETEGKDGEGSDDGTQADVEKADAPPAEPDVYDRFSKRRKATILAIVSFSAFLSPVCSSIFLPSIPVMSAELHTTASVIDYTVAIFLVTIGIAPLIWSPLSGFYGRRPVYLVSLPIMVVASIGVAVSRNVGDIIGTRVLQGIGGCAVLSVGAGSVGDIFRPTERANAMGWFYSGALMGPSFAPVIGGLFTQYTDRTWRSAQYFVAGITGLACALVFLFLPETSHPPLPHTVLKQARGKKFVLFKFNPVSILRLFAWPNICAITFVSSCTLLETYAFIVPLATVFKEKYGITNIALSGCLYIANGAGNFLGARIAGPMADATVRRYIKKRGYRRPEDRLRSAFWALAAIIPLSSIAYGWLLQFAKGGIAPPLIITVINGIGVMLVFTPVNTYAVDVMQKRSAEVIAVNNCVRYLFSAASSAFVLPMADGIGWGLTGTICAILMWLSAAVLWLNVHHGWKWREAADRRTGTEPAFPPEAERQAEIAALRAVDPEAVLLTDKSARAAVHEKVSQETSAASTKSEVHDHEHDHDHGEGDHGEPTQLVSPTSVRGLKDRRLDGTGAGSGAGSGLEGGRRPGGGSRPGVSRSNTLTRETSGSSAADMPDVHHVLSRTISLTGGSVHGGG